MKRHKGGEFVQSGIYRQAKAWELVYIPEEGGYLPAEGTYYRMSPLLLMIVGPLFGLAFIVFLPLAVPLMFLYAAGKVIARKLSSPTKEASEHLHG